MPRRLALIRSAAPLVLLAALAGAACTDAIAPDQQKPAASADIVYAGPVFTWYWPATPQISAGAAHTCALRRDWVALCWGARYDGRLGDGGQLGSP